MSQLENKVAVVTGGNGVLGGAIAKGFAARNIRIGVLGRNSDTVNSRVNEINNNGGEAIALVADVLDEASLEEARKKVLEKWGKIDILLNAAGGNISGATINPEQTFFDLNIKDLDKVSQLNFKGTVLPTYVFARGMAERKSGSIINISSIAAQRTLTRVLGYSAAKAAVENFTKWLAVEMAHKYGEGIRVNAIAPGFFIGEQNRSLLLDDHGELTSRGNSIIHQTPMRRFGKPEELQGAANWLAGEDASFVTGIVIPVDGGFAAFSGV